MVNYKLKPCPFCGCVKLRISEFDDHIDDTIKYGVECLACGAIPWRDLVDNDEAIHRWNWRAGGETIKSEEK